MSEEELREKILDLLNKPSNCKTFSNVWLEYKTDQILDLIRTEKGLIHKEMVDSLIDSAYDLGKYDREKELKEAGYEPPESVREMVEKSYEDGVDDTEQKYKGYMSTEMVKGLVFELQAKKCAACPKNKEGK